MQTANSGQKRFLIPLVALLVSLAAGDAHAKGKAKAKARPFKLNGTGVWDDITRALPVPAGEEQPVATFAGEANATHLGKVTQFGDLVLFSNPLATGSAPGGGSVTLIAANGDEVYFDYDGVLFITGATSALGVGDLTITGGTGRFANATGQASFVAEFDLSGGFQNVPMEVSVDGSITY